jgi:histidine phosphotransferase ChpT
MAQDLDLAEIVAARICHDLVGPVGAVSNGIELMGDGSAPDPEVTALIAVSAQQAAARLQAFRVVFGSGNALPAGSMFAEVRRLATALFDGDRVKLDWPTPDGAIEAAATRPAAKLALNLTMMGMEALPRGGTVQVQQKSAGGRMTMTVVAAGKGAKLPDELLPALEGKMALDDVTPRSVSGFILARLTSDIGGTLSVKAVGPDRLDLIADVPLAQ